MYQIKPITVGGGCLEQQVIYHVYYKEANCSYTTPNTSLTFNACLVTNETNETVSVNVSAVNRFKSGPSGTYITHEIGKGI